MFRKFNVFGLRTSAAVCLSAITLLALLSLSGCGGSSNPVSVTVTSSSATVDATDSVTITASVTNDKTPPQGATWTVTGGGTLSNSSTTGATYTAPAASSSAVTVTVTATSVADTTKTGTTTLTVPAKPAITTGTLPAGSVGAVYTATLAGSGGISPYKWTLTGGTLPTAWTLTSAGVLSGPAPVAGQVGATNLTFELTDSGTATALTASQQLALTISPAAAIAFTGSVPATATWNTSYSGSAATTGGAGALTYTVASGAMPTGLSLNAATGAITGKPTAVGTFNLTIKAADAYGDSATQAYTIAVNQATPTLNFAAIPTKTYGGPTFTVSASSASSGAVTYSVTSGPATIAGATVTLTGAGTVVLGTSQAATADYTVATASTSFTVNGEAPTLSFAVIPTHTFGDAPFAVSATSASSGAVTYSVTSGQATIAGSTVTLTGAGTVVLGASQAANGNYASATATASFTVNPALSIATSSSLPGGVVATAYSDTLAATGGSGGDTWSTNAAGTTSLAAIGLGLSSGGVVSGASPTLGTATFTGTVTDSASHTASLAFSVTVSNALTVTTTSLPAAYSGTAYSQTLAAAGGTGTGYTWTATGTSNLATFNLTLSAAGVLTGTPAASGTASFTAKVTDSASNTATQAFTFAVYNALTLPAPNPNSLPSATVSQSYSGSINVTGGVPPYTWTVTGLPSNGLSSSSSGGMLSISGTPTATGTVTFTASVTDSASHTTGTSTYTIAVNSAGSQVSGTINLNNNCSGSSVPAITVSINTSPVQTTTTYDSQGDFSFASIPNGTYTITPSITGPSSVFSPATYSGVVVNNGTVSGENFNASLGYTVSGTVSYPGAQTGQVYLNLNNTNCGGSGGPGTSITDATLKLTGAYTIRGVAPGNYTLQAWMDTQGFGAANADNPVPLSSPSVTVVSSSPTGQNVALADPAAVSLSGLAPTIKAVNPFYEGAAILNRGIVNGNQVEMPASYTVQWSTSATWTAASGFATVAGHKSIPATGTKGNPWLLDGLTNGQAYYFSVQGVAGSSTSNFSPVSGPVTIGAPTGGNAVSGTVTFSQTATGPLYVGFVDQNSNAIYATVVGSQASPPTSPAAYSVQVPTGSDYFFFGILDQNNNGIINSPGEVSNAGGGNDQTVTSISGTTSGEDLTLPTANSTAKVTTQYSSSTSPGGSSTGYSLNFDVRAGIKLPVAVTLTSGPNMINPVDIGNLCSGCGSIQFQLYPSIGGAVPSVGDAYTFKVTYSDGTVENGTVTAAVTGVLTASQLETNLAPTGTGGSTTPTFTWTYPANASNYIYQFSICCDTNGTIWQIPGNDSNLNGFPSTVTQIVWGTDPTGDTNNSPNGSLNTGTSYSWYLETQDSNGNQAVTGVNYIP
jgi:large repetitive protein